MPAEPNHEFKSIPSIVINLDADSACQTVDSNSDRCKRCRRDGLSIECFVALGGMIELLDTSILTTGGLEYVLVESHLLFFLSDGVI